MRSNIINFPRIPRATVHIAPEDERDPHTAAIEQMKKAIQYSINRCGRAWTLNVLQSAIEMDASTDWRSRAKALFSKENK